MLRQQQLLEKTTHLRQYKIVSESLQFLKECLKQHDFQNARAFGTSCLSAETLAEASALGLGQGVGEYLGRGLGRGLARASLQDLVKHSQGFISAPKVLSGSMRPLESL